MGIRPEHTARLRCGTFRSLCANSAASEPLRRGTVLASVLAIHALPRTGNEPPPSDK
jgi:hypothetical protein